MMSEQQVKFLMTVRQCLIMVLGALEDLLDLPRSIVPRRKRIFNGQQEQKDG